MASIRVTLRSTANWSVLFRDWLLITLRWAKVSMNMFFTNRHKKDVADRGDFRRFTRIASTFKKDQVVMKDQITQYTLAL